MNPPSYYPSNQTQDQTQLINSFTTLNIFGRFAKRLLDIIAASLGLVLLSPFFVLIGIKIKRDFPGPVFFRGLRLGKNGGTLKF